MGVIIFDRGGMDDPESHIIHTRGVLPAASVTNSPPEESLADLTQRAYGRNTRALRDKIRRANSSLDGQVRIPK